MHLLPFSADAYWVSQSSKTNGAKKTIVLTLFKSPHSIDSPLSFCFRNFDGRGYKNLLHLDNSDAAV
jgi:hypothetical protein